MGLWIQHSTKFPLIPLALMWKTLKKYLRKQHYGLPSFHYFCTVNFLYFFWMGNNIMYGAYYTYVFRERQFLIMRAIYFIFTNLGYWCTWTSDVYSYLPPPSPPTRFPMYEDQQLFLWIFEWHCFNNNPTLHASEVKNLINFIIQTQLILLPWC